MSFTPTLAEAILTLCDAVVDDEPPPAQLGLALLDADGRPIATLRLRPPCFGRRRIDVRPMPGRADDAIRLLFRAGFGTTALADALGYDVRSIVDALQPIAEAAP